MTILMQLYILTYEKSKVNDSFFENAKKGNRFFETGNRKDQGLLKRRKRLRAAFLAALLGASLTGCPGRAEEDFIPPTPEPPAERVERPTPVPTPMPDRTIVDHVNHPEDYPGFYFPQDAKVLHIWIPNIRDADEAVLVFEGQVYMIDCGDEKMGARGAAMLKQLGISYINLLFNTHPHHDHINGLAVTDDAATIGSIRVCMAPELTESGNRMIATAAERGIPVSEFRDGDVYAMGKNAEVTLTFWHNTDENLDVNNRSAQTLVRYGNRTILFTADMERSGQLNLLSRIDPSVLRCDILKYPHHAKSALAEEFYEACGAKLAVVTSKQGREDEGQKYMTMKHLPAVFTSTADQYTHLATDGNTWLCEYVNIEN